MFTFLRKGSTDTLRNQPTSNCDKLSAKDCAP